MYAGKKGTSTDAGTIEIDPCRTPGHAGCPCSEVGQVIDCGRIDYVSGDYVTCSMGQTTCDGVTWGACVGNRIVAQSLKGHALTPAGKRTLSSTQDCVSPCDPQCVQVVGEVKDVDAGGITVTDDGGITLTQSVGAGPGSGPCKGLWCNVDACPGKPKTSISGVVYDPAGKVPLYNAYVYVPVDPKVALPGFTSGVSCDTCAGATDVSAVAVAQTGPDGKFTLNNVPYGDNLVPLVVQMGKWRRKITLPKISPCEDNPIAAQYTRLPRNRFDGDDNQADIPRMALASGSADPFECLLLKAGIDPAEIKVPSGDHRIDYYKYNGKDIAPGGAPAGSTLTGSLDTLKKYDVVLLPCEGAENAHNTEATKVEAYANLGGRMFTTHFGYVWLATPSSAKTPSNLTSFYGTANWKLGLSDYTDPMTATVDQSFPKGAAFAQWMQNVGATTTSGKPVINEPRHNALTAISPSQRWIYGSTSNSTASYRDMLLSMTFNTPIAAAADKQCGRVVFSDFHVSADALMGNGTSCSSDNDCGFTATCKPPTAGTCAPKTCTSNAGCSTSFSCNGASQGSCSTQSCITSTQCGSGRTCVGGSAGTCLTPCYQTSDCGWGWSSCNGGAIGTCAAASCKVDGDCGVGTCNGEAPGSCVPEAKTCWTNPDCASLNASATCGGAVTGTCSTACRTATDCGGSACSGAAVGTCKPPTTSCYTDATCTPLNSGATCEGETLGTCSVKTCTASSQCGNGTCSSTKTCYRSSNGAVGGTCTTNADCPNKYSCVNLCSTSSCSADAQCGTGRTCNGESAGTCSGPSQNCHTNEDCTGLGTGYTCNGGAMGNCPAKSGCKSDADCGGTRVCNGESAGSCTGPTLSCWDDTTCKTSLGAQYSCSNPVLGSCSSVSCKTNGDCGGTRSCSGAAQGTCSSGGWPTSCGSDSECSGTKRCIGGVTGACSPGNCYANSDCGTTGTCSAGASLGACQKACTTDAECGSLTCVSGQCQGCTADNLCASNTCVGDVARACTASGSMFPLSCRQGDLSGQEKALEFMLFDLSACVSPDSWAPPVPSVSYSPITFTLDFESKCALGQMAVWREFDWKAEIPSGTNIVFSAQTANAVVDVATAQAVPLATATNSTVVPGWDVAIIETTTTGAFQSASPRIVSLATLRVTVTLNPSNDKKAAPTLTAWQTAYDCLDRE